MTDQAPILRPAARVLLIDAEDRLLLLNAALFTGRCWIAPGGGVLPGESYEEAALRELWEETGVKADAPEACVWTLNFIYHYNGVTREHQERYFVVRVDAVEIDAANRDEHERIDLLEHRWWTLDEVIASEEPFRPRNLASLLPPILAGELPVQPLALEREDRTPT